LKKLVELARDHQIVVFLAHAPINQTYTNEADLMRLLSEQKKSLSQIATELKVLQLDQDFYQFPNEHTIHFDKDHVHEAGAIHATEHYVNLLKTKL
jgi:hypothetical protein